jgi:hypothetical protein
LAGGVPEQGVVVEKIHKKGTEYGRFPTLFGLKIAENAFFCSKVFNKMQFKDFFLMEYLNFETFRYLKHCGVIFVPSFRSHICPQPSGLGLKFAGHSNLKFHVSYFI